MIGKKVTPGNTYGGTCIFLTILFYLPNILNLCGRQTKHSFMCNSIEKKFSEYFNTIKALLLKFCHNL